MTHVVVLSGSPSSSSRTLRLLRHVSAALVAFASALRDAHGGSASCPEFTGVDDEAA